MIIISILKNILKGLRDYYVNNLKEDYERRINNPIKMMIFDLTKTAVMIIIIITIFVIMTPSFRSAIDYGIENYTTYHTRIDDLTNQVKSAKDDMIGAALRTVRQFKNPTFDGIRISNINGLYSVYPTSCSMLEKRIYYLLAKWAKSEGYDGVLFGESYSGLNGVFYWTDGKNPAFDTDMELIINFLKEKGCKHIMSFISNTESKNYIPYVDNYITGLFIISEVQNYRLNICSHKFWKTNRSIVIKADNFSAEVIDEIIEVSSRPRGLKNEVVVYYPQKKSFIDGIKDETLEQVRKIKSIMNMAEVVDK